MRYLLLTAHYRETFNFTLDGLAGAKTALARIDECIGKLRERAADMLALEKNPAKFRCQFAASVHRCAGRRFEHFRRVGRGV